VTGSNPSATLVGMATARQASVTDRVGRALMHVWGVLACLPALAVWVAAFLVDQDSGTVLVAAAVTTAFGVPLAVVLWREAAQRKLDTERLGRAGVPATAEIVSVEVVAGDEHPDEARLRLRVSGPGVPPFEAAYRCLDRPSLLVGAQLDAVVDPSDNLFTLVRH
jgi:hypothetical protein